MQPPVKAVILGLTNSGKSTTAALLAQRGWPVVEIDDLAQARNNDIWPEEEAVLDRLFKEINEEILHAENIVFVTSFLEIADVKRFHATGFTIIELHASYDELVRRKIQRDGVPKDNYERFNRNYNNFQVIMAQVPQYITLSIDTTGEKSEEVADKVEKRLIS